MISLQKADFSKSFANGSDVAIKLVLQKNLESVMDSIFIMFFTAVAFYFNFSLQWN